MRKHPEDNLQIAVMDYLRLQYPKILAWHTVNEGKIPVHYRKKLIRKGLKKGIPDIIIVQKKRHNSIIMFGIAMELKIKYNKPSPEQIEVLDYLEGEGMITAVCYDFDSAKEVIDNYLK